MNKVLTDYERSKVALFEYFGCKDEYPVKILDRCKWRITYSDDISFLCYWTDEKGRQDAVVPKKDGQPVICRKKDFSMVVAIDCVKIAFILNNKNEVPE